MCLIKCCHYVLYPVQIHSMFVRLSIYRYIIDYRYSCKLSRCLSSCLTANESHVSILSCYLSLTTNYLFPHVFYPNRDVFSSIFSRHSFAFVYPSLILSLPLHSAHENHRIHLYSYDRSLLIKSTKLHIQPLIEATQGIIN